jgi:hypothetical protein
VLVLWIQAAPVINDYGELLGVKITAGNVDDRDPVPALAHFLFGKLNRFLSNFGNRACSLLPRYARI